MSVVAILTKGVGMRRALVTVGTVWSLAIFGATVFAEPLDVKAITSPKEQIYVDLPTPQKHFVLFVKREGKTKGTLIQWEVQGTFVPGPDGKPKLLEST